MAGLTVPDAKTALSMPVSTKRVRIPPRVSKAIRLLLSGECRSIKAAATRVKMDYGHLCESIRKPQVQVFIAQRTRETIVSAQMPAAATIVRLLNDDSGHVQADIAKHVLAIAGIAPPQGNQVTVNVDVSPGYVIDVSAERVVPHEQTTQAKPLTHKDSVPNDE